jgi:CHAD domain-containing protein
MAMAQMDKWIPHVSPDDRTSDVAGRTLRSRLASVRDDLPPAALKPAEDIEYVHELRVATRRAMAAMRLYAEMLPRRRAARMEKRLKQILRAAGKARDYDVLAQRLSDAPTDPEAQRFLKKVRARRQQAQQPIGAVYRRLKRDDCFDRWVKKLLRGVRPRRKTNAEPKDARFGDWARTQLTRVVKRFFKAAPADDKDPRTLHRFRIRGKELRYAMELLAGAFPPYFVDKLYPVVETLQQLLGEINDHATAEACIRQRIVAADDPSEAGHLRNLIEEEYGHLNLSRRAFVQWWTPEREEGLRARFDELLSGNRVPTQRNHRCDRNPRASGESSGRSSKTIRSP